MKITYFLTMVIVLMSCTDDEPAPGDTTDDTTENSAPSISDQTFSVDENSAVGTSVGSISASDSDADPLTFSLTAGNTGDAFELSSAGELTVKTTTALDFESTPSFALTISVSDGTLNASATVTVSLNDVAETSTSCLISEISFDSDKVFFTRENGNITSIKETYIDEDNGSQQEEESTFTYTDDKLTGFTEVGGDSQYELIYTGDDLTTVKESNDTEGDSEYRLTWTSGKLSLTQQWNTNAAGTLVLNETLDITYDGDKATTITQTEAETGEVTVKNYEYDDKTNPFYNELAWFLYGDNFFWYLSPNNITKETSVGNWIDTWTYEYNEHGYPVTSTIDFLDLEDGSTDTSSFNSSYDCD